MGAGRATSPATTPSARCSTRCRSPPRPSPSAPRAAARALEPLAAAGTLIVVGYGLSGRLLPGLVTEHPQVSAAGRLDQPLTYWNAMGALAAIGLVLCARLAGDRERPRALRAAAAAVAVPLGMGCYLSFSRGALAALAAGLLALVCSSPRTSGRPAARRRLVVGSGRGRRARRAASPRRARARGSLGTREREGAIVLAVALVL